MRRRTERGFTLLEIIVALAIAAAGIAAVAQYTATSADVAHETEQRMLAVWTAGNRLAELRITRAWPSPGGYDQQVDMGGRTWYLTESVDETDLENIRRVDIDVYTDPEHDNREFGLYGYISRYQPPEEVVPEGGEQQQQDEQHQDEGRDTEAPAGEDEDASFPGDDEAEPPGESGDDPDGELPEQQG